MQFVAIVFLAALVSAVDSLVAGDRTSRVPDSIDYPQLQGLRTKRSVGVTQDVKREWEIKKKDGSSVRVSKSVSYSDGGALTLLPAVMDSASNNRIRYLNQLQNGQGRPELANQMINGASSSGDSSVDAGIESRQASVDTGRFVDWEAVLPHKPTTTAASVDVEAPSTHVVVVPVTARPVVVNPVPVHPVVITPVTPQPIVSKPVVVCCGQSRPVVSVPVSVIAVQTGSSHSHLRRHLEKSIDYHRRKQIKKQNFLNKLAAKQQATAVVAVVPAQHVHTPDCGHLQQPTAVVAVGGYRSKHDGLKELIAYKKALKAQQRRDKLAAYHAYKAAKYGKCPTYRC